MVLPKSLTDLIDQFNHLPGIGRKTAQRLALHLLKGSSQDIEGFIKALSNMKENIRECSNCYGIAEAELCPICSSEKRDKKVVCVVEEPGDVLAIERANEFYGVYHILGGTLSPLKGVSPHNLNINKLLERTNEQGITEVIFALNPDSEGEATVMYLSKLLKEKNLKLSKLARGIPMGGEIEFADEATIGRALTFRVDV